MEIILLKHLLNRREIIVRPVLAQIIPQSSNPFICKELKTVYGQNRVLLSKSLLLHIVLPEIYVWYELGYSKASGSVARALNNDIFVCLFYW